MQNLFVQSQKLKYYETVREKNNNETRSGVFIVNFKQISHNVQVVLLFNLNK